MQIDAKILLNCVQFASVFWWLSARRWGDVGGSVGTGVCVVVEARPNNAVATRYRWVARTKKKTTAAPSVLVWSPTTILGKALGCLNRTDRTGSLVFTRVWPQLEE